MRPILELRTGEDVRRMLVTGVVTIGRAPSNSLAFNDPTLSSVHLEIRCEGEQVILRDLDSKTGTFVNGQQVRKAVLASGDEIKAGKVRLRFLLKPDKPPKPEKPEKQEQPASPPQAPKPSKPARGEKSSRIARPRPQPPAARVEPSPARIKPASKPEADPALPLTPEAPAPLDTSLRAPKIAGVVGDSNAGRFSQAGDDDDERPTQEVIDAAIATATALSKLVAALPNKQLDESMVTMLDTRGHPVPMPTVRGAKEAVLGGKDGLLFLRGLLLLCLRIRATDLHIEFRETFAHVRVRVDGMMVSVVDLHRTTARRLHRVVKVLGDLDIAHPTAMQEGRFALQAADRRINLRTSFTPAMHGQKLVIRLLDHSDAPHQISELGLPTWMEQDLRKAIRKDSGMVLVCGPTGSGKTTTLYTLIRGIDRSARNVVTIENPVESQIENTTQLPIQAEQGLSFSAMLRSVLRQDPDVILVGEVRDAETAAIAMQAAMTGHLVFSTVHARDSIGTIFRLLDLEIEPYLVASALQFVIAQRLARKLCESCRQVRKPTPSEATLLANHSLASVPEVCEPVGCLACLETGFLGRRAIFELLTFTDALRDVILTKPQMQDLRKAARHTLFTTLRDHGYRLVVDKVTSLDEVDRVIGAE